MKQQSQGGLENKLNSAGACRFARLAFIGLILGSVAITALSFGVGAIIKHHEAIYLATEHQVITNGTCQGWKWHWAKSAASVCGMVNDATSLQYAAVGLSGFSLLMPLVLVFLAFLLYRRPSTLGYSFPPLVAFSQLSTAISFSGQIGLLLLSGYLGADLIFNGGISVAALILILYPWPLFALIALSKAIFKIRDWGRFPIRGVSLPGKNAPMLWDSVRQVACSIGAQMPDNIIACLRGSFFVSRARIDTPGGPVTGATLCIPTLATRLFSDAEFTACIGHELAHLRRGTSPAVIILAGNWAEILAQMNNDSGSAVATVLALSFPGTGASTFMLYFLSWFAAKGFPAYEFEADRVGASASKPEALACALIKQGFVEYMYMPKDRGSQRSDKEEQQLHTTLGQESNYSQLFTDRFRSVLKNGTPRGLRAALKSVENKYCSPFHPPLTARASVLGVDLEQAFAQTVAEAEASEPSFVDELSAAEEALTSFEKSPSKLDDGETEVSARNRVMREPNPAADQ